MSTSSKRSVAGRRWETPDRRCTPQRRHVLVGGLALASGVARTCACGPCLPGSSHAGGSTRSLGSGSPPIEVSVRYGWSPACVLGGLPERRTFVMNIVLLIARLLLAVVFLVAGV